MIIQKSTRYKGVTQAIDSFSERSVDVEFPTDAESMVKPPNPEFIRAAFARVLSLSCAIDYFDKVE